MTDVTFSPVPQQGESPPQNVTSAAQRRTLSATDTIEPHARQLLRERIAQREIAKLVDRIEVASAETDLPGNLRWHG